jgi:hypothetical protein
MLRTLAAVMKMTPEGEPIEAEAALEAPEGA